MALSLPGERSIAAASPAHPFGALVTWFSQAKARRARINGLKSLLELDRAQLLDLGITRSDVLEAMTSRNGRTPGMVLNTARARSARS